MVVPQARERHHPASPLRWGPASPARWRTPRPADKPSFREVDDFRVPGLTVSLLLVAARQTVLLLLVHRVRRRSSYQLPAASRPTASASARRARITGFPVARRTASSSGPL